MKRVLLFVGTNIAILMVLSLSMTLLGVEPWLTPYGIDLGGLLIFAAVFGFGGSFISLAISRWMAKRMMGVRVITQPSNPTEVWLVETVKRYAQQSGIGMPEVGIYNAPDINAFATGMTKNRSLVAVSSGLVEQMTRGEADAVLGHEVAHIANGDMVTLALIQGVMNTFVIFLSRVIGFVVDRFIFRSEEARGPGFWITVVIADIVLGILAMIVVMWFSRKREFRADEGGAHLAGRAAMVAALERLNRQTPQPLPDAMAAFGIAGGRGRGIKRLFMTHPPLEERIAALEAGPRV